MKKIAFVPLCLAVFLLTGCSSVPKVAAELTEHYPSRSADSVMVYKIGDTIPAAARPIGKVKVTDGGFTPAYRCLYGNVLALAVKKTAESGGNALRIDEHRTPNVWSSTCHRIWGTMYIVPDSLVTGDTPSILQEIEQNEDAELAAMARQQIAAVDKMANTPHNIIKVSAGPSWINSKIDMGHRVYSSKVGFEYALQYQHIFRIIGFGVDFLHYSTSFDEGSDLNLLYVGPSMAFKYSLGKKWLLDASVGVGYSQYKEKAQGFSYTEGKLGVMGEVGIEYMLSKHVGLGIQANALSMRMKKPEGYHMEDNEFYGIQRINLMGGVRFYF